MTFQEKDKVTPQQYLALLIDVYRGYNVGVPNIEREAEKNILKDLLSAAISFAQTDKVRQVLSEEIFHCVQGNCSFQQQMKLAQQQTPDILNAKMTAAAYVMRILDAPGKSVLS